jgi:hypothetical protein
MKNPEERKPVHVVRCRECDGFHRINIKETIIGIGPTPPEPIPDEFYSVLFRREIKCPKTGDTFIPAEDDWLHLTEDEFHRRFPGNRNI